VRFEVLIFLVISYYQKLITTIKNHWVYILRKQNTIKSCIIVLNNKIFFLLDNFLLIKIINITVTIKQFKSSNMCRHYTITF